MSNIEKIRQEIKRRKKENMYVDLPMSIGRYYEDRDILAFIDSLPEEKPSEDLEEVAARYELENRQSMLSSVDIVDAFIAGAEWQKKELLKGSPLPEDTVLFQKGIEEGKRLMMEDAVEGEIGYWNQRGLSIRLDQSLEKLGYDEDTKVKIIIMKQ